MIHPDRRAAWTVRIPCAVAFVLLNIVSNPCPADTGWVLQTSHTAASLYSVHFVDAAHGWVAGDQGTILATADGGANWTQQTSGTPYNLRGIGFSSLDHGIAVGEGGTILRTTDGGLQWGVIRTDWMDGFAGLHVLDSQHAWACGSNAIFQPWVARTTDGGLAWSFFNFYIQNNEGSLTDIFFLNASTGLATATIWDGRGAVVRSTDGGANWNPAIVTPKALLSIDFADSQNGFACGIDGTLYRSTDSGITWSAIPSGSLRWLYGISFPAATTASIVGEAGTILRTTNGGLNWSLQEAPTTVPLYAVDFIDRLVGTAVGSAGTILHTDTGGESGAGVDGPGIGDVTTSEVTLRPSFPNPFHDVTTFSWDLPSPAAVRIEIVDPAGRRVRSVQLGVQRSGRNAWSWDGRDGVGRLVPRGVYLGRILVGPPESGRSAGGSPILFLGR